MDTQTLIEYLNNSMSENSMQFHVESPANMLHTKITNISRKHLLSMLANGCYEVGNVENNDDETIRNSTNKTAAAATSPPPFAYLINSDLMHQLDSHMASVSSAEAAAAAIRKRECELLQKKGSSRCALFNVADNYLSTLYVIVKFFYLLSALCQLFFLNRLIGNNFYILGITLLKTFFNEIEWPHLDVFPVLHLVFNYLKLHSLEVRT